MALFALSCLRVCTKAMCMTNYVNEEIGLVMTYIL